VIRVLSIHADYACRNTGVCCSSGWDVPVEPAIEERLRQALSKGALRAPRATHTPFRAAAGLPHGARVVFGCDEGGRCVFLGVLGLRLSLSVLRAEASRGAGGPPGEGGLREAIRRADLLLVHLADPETLARCLSRVEGLSGDPAPTW
jgi:hypothetical protein